MKLKRITLQNFKGDRGSDYFLDGKTTVLFGINGVGKSKSNIGTVFFFEDGEEKNYGRSYGSGVFDFGQKRLDERAGA